MAVFDRWWEGLFSRTTRKVEDPGLIRQIAGLLEAWVSIIGNILLFGVKFAVGTAIGSIALVADSFHTLSDVLTSVVVLIGFKVAGRAPDREHPFGHGRGENIATLVIAVLLVIVGVEFLTQSVKRMLHPTPVAGTLMVAAMMIVFGALKELMAAFSIWLGRRIDSMALLADAWHHRSDAIASVLVAVAVVGAIYRVYWLDGLFGIGVSVLIVYTGFELGRSAADYLLGSSPSDKILSSIREEAAVVNGVVGVHDVNVHDYGLRHAISLHVEVQAAMNVSQAHLIADEVERRIAKKMNADTVVHIDPPEGGARS